MQRLTVHVEGQFNEEVYELDDAHARRLATRIIVGDRECTYDLPKAQAGYLVIKGNRASFSQVPEKSIFAYAPSAVLNVSVATESGKFDLGSKLFLLLYDKQHLIEKLRLPLDVDKKVASFQLPDRAGFATLAVRLTGSSKVAPIKLAYRFTDRVQSKSSKNETPAPLNANAHSRAPDATLALTTLGRKAASIKKINAAGNGHLPWNMILEQSRNAGTRLEIYGVAHPAGESRRHFKLLRVDEEVETGRLSSIAGYIFDTTAAESLFGWEQTLSPNNMLATITLVRHLTTVRAAGLPAVLVYDDVSARRPFFKDLRPLFTESVHRQALPSADYLHTLFEALPSDAEDALNA